MKRIVLFIAMIVLVSAICPAQQTSAFNYQGKLGDGGSAANGMYQFQFKLFDDPAAGVQIGTTQSASALVTNGLLTTLIDFGSAAFAAGQDRWLEISIRPVN